MLKHPETHAVILAAGVGSRLGPAAAGRPKCLIEVGGHSLLHHHFMALYEVGVRRVTVVAGHLADQVMKATKSAGVVQFNEVYADTNSLYSLWLARHWVNGPLMVINGDVLADPQIYRDLLEAKGSALAFDSGSGRQAEEMKVRFEGGVLCEITKQMDPHSSHGENLGILKFDAPGARALFEEADRMVSRGRVNEWAPAAVDRMAREVPIRGIDMAGLPWTEIDFPEDLRLAREEVWPAIRRNPTTLSRENYSSAPSSGSSPVFIPQLAS